ncbi:N-acetylglucosamine-specific PTS transporter subunit IIBC [Croceibacterium ferulae]|uniref:N-acetylglucosamine-specific PTS transporter subunit IIBC n=1 Tax=Croceibacterium ferulae TaxID=1854641 RepID=UPI000EAED093|nr:N-acetylglucosamine-specific PTS transporter subunit IIBC [Croceibacterium ferulae]
MEPLQALGRALMLPIAVLPIAGLLLRLGQPDLLDIAFISAAGNAVFANLGLLFAAGVATAYARDGNGAAALAAIVCYLVTTQGAAALLRVPETIGAGLPAEATAAIRSDWAAAAIGRLAVPIGIVAGLIGGQGYNRLSGIRLPAYLGFFGGRRFVPIASGAAGVLLALLVGLAYPALSTAIEASSAGILGSGEAGLFVFGLLNRLLLVTGLHHILNNIVWFVVGDYGAATGDLRRFFAGDPTAGAFMSGFFPVMMFGLPAACLAMYRTALPERRKAVGGMLLSMAATSFLTGVTEPIEFTFMFLAPALFVAHAVLTGLSMMLMSALDVRLGFGFSAGLFDYVLNFGQATRPLLWLPIGLGYALLYYSVFVFAIRRLDLATPGRDRLASAEAGPESELPTAAGDRSRAGDFIAALGGPGNLLEVGACTTRLRLRIADRTALDEPFLKRLGAHGLIYPSANAVQIVLGPVADQVAEEITAALASGRPAGASPGTASAAPTDTPLHAPMRRPLPAAIRAALGEGARWEVTHSRLIVSGGDVNEDELRRIGLRGSVRMGETIHLLFAPEILASSPDATAEPTGRSAA